MRIIFFVCFLIVLYGCNNPSKQKVDSNEVTNEAIHDIIYNPRSAKSGNEKRAAKVEVVGKSKFDFGSVESGEKVSHRFIIKNVGDAPMNIVEANASCGCTVPHYRKGQIDIQDTSSILVVFDSKNREGAQNKKVSIYTNTVPNETIFTFTGNVELKTKN